MMGKESEKVMELEHYSSVHNASTYPIKHSELNSVEKQGPRDTFGENKQKQVNNDQVLFPGDLSMQQSDQI